MMNSLDRYEIIAITVTFSRERQIQGTDPTREIEVEELAEGNRTFD